MTLVLKEFNEVQAEAIRTWFDDKETRKWLGDRSWLDMELKQQKESIGKEFRGAKTIARYGWVAYDDDKAVGYIDADISDRYVEYGGQKDGNPIYLNIEDELTSGLAYVVNPLERSKG